MAEALGVALTAALTSVATGVVDSRLFVSRVVVLVSAALMPVVLVSAAWSVVGPTSGLRIGLAGLVAGISARTGDGLAALPRRTLSRVVLVVRRRAGAAALPGALTATFEAALAAGALAADALVAGAFAAGALDAAVLDAAVLDAAAAALEAEALEVAGFGVAVFDAADFVDGALDESAFETRALDAVRDAGFTTAFFNFDLCRVFAATVIACLLAERHASV
ncbi:hypothetical protein [Rhodoplanes sp. SY1]|uniref:hypothetical protein n=1 Tax=Rhodoplanes sp. SY1 TaxID=3166646 RepID=UPI0038B4D6DF